MNIVKKEGRGASWCQLVNNTITWEEQLRYQAQRWRLYWLTEFTEFTEPPYTACLSVTGGVAVSGCTEGGLTRCWNVQLLADPRCLTPTLPSTLSPSPSPSSRHTNNTTRPRPVSVPSRSSRPPHHPPAGTCTTLLTNCFRKVDAKCDTRVRH